MCLDCKKIENAKMYIQWKASFRKQPNGKYKSIQSRRLENKVKKQFNIQIEYIIDELKGVSAFKDDKKVKILSKKDIQSDAENIANSLPNEDDLVNDIVVTVDPVYKKGGKTAYDKFKMGKFGIDFSIVNDNSIGYLENLRDIQLSNRKGSITRTTRKRIIEIITDGARNGNSYSEMARQIRLEGESGIFSRARAEMIAVNQVGNAYETGNKETIDEYVKETGAVIEKKWMTVNDDQVTEECMANQDEGWIGNNEDFSSGDSEAPRSDNPRCRCTTGYRQVDDEGNPI